jgi:hypothetical protein
MPWTSPTGRSAPAPAGDHFGQPAHVAGYHRHTAGHGLQGHETERLAVAGQEEQIGARQDLGDRLLLAQIDHAVIHALFDGDLLGVAALRPIADEDQPGRTLPGDPRRTRAPRRSLASPSGSWRCA